MRSETFVALLVLNFLALPVYAEDIEMNPMFGDNSNQLAIHGGESFRSDGFEKLHFGAISYSQPDTFFRLPARNNIEVGAYKGDGSLAEFDVNFFGFSKDVALLSGTNSYLTLGLGAYIKDKKTDRISSKFTFGEKLAVGYRFDNGINVELFARHFSNGGLTEKNSGQNFAGLTVGYSF
ncbi:acyloxyacyl hydrolase [Zooshikella marina]|uniref:acyloxyacyl hydrolase n=1 Tax=Zooshikella ganghwensis TaxID=202772 RepID=UPI001BB070AA|nr:acyloxyacyl hydrolase [Zooshikella ganghwensis]MBU2705635.1 acyloxyacyl hydrolase [Zooshikella ganghwensis]